VDPAVILGDVDAQLKKKGKEVGELPPPPEPAPVFKAGAPAKAAPSSQPDTSGVIANIDQALKRKGIDPAKIEEATKIQAEPAESQGAAAPQRAKREEKIELAPRLGTEKGPFLLDPRELPAQDKPEESEEAGKAAGLQPSAPSSSPESQPPKGLPEAVVKGPPQPVKEKPQEAPKVAPTKRPDEENEAPKGTLDQLREDIEKVGKILNPLNW
jgi:hypothetical protein